MDNSPHLGEGSVLQGFAFPEIQSKDSRSLPHAFSTDADTK